MPDHPSGEEKEHSWELYTGGNLGHSAILTCPHTTLPPPCQSNKTFMAPLRALEQMTPC